MIGFIAKRLVNYLILTVNRHVAGYALVSTTLQPAARFLGKNPPVPQSSIDAALDKMGVNPDVSLLQRMWDWLVQFVTTGSLGISTRSTEVTADIIERAGTSLRLLIIGSILGAIFGILLGVWGAIRQYRASDQIITYASFTVLATPIFVIAVLLMIGATWVNNASGQQLINFTGEYSVGVTGFWPVIGDRIAHLLLPTIALTVTAAASTPGTSAARCSTCCPRTSSARHARRAAPADLPSCVTACASH